MINVSVVEYDQVKIVIKQRKNYRPILYVHYYNHGKLAEVKFTVEEEKIEKFIRAATAELEKVEYNGKSLQTNYRNMGSLEIEDYHAFKGERLFSSFYSAVDRKVSENRRKQLAGVRNLKVNRKSSLFSKIKKIKKVALRVGIAVLVPASLAAVLHTLEKFPLFAMNKPGIEAEIAPKHSEPSFSSAVSSPTETEELIAKVLGSQETSRTESNLDSIKEDTSVNSFFSTTFDGSKEQTDTTKSEVEEGSHLDLLHSQPDETVQTQATEQSETNTMPTQVVENPTVQDTSSSGVENVDNPVVDTEPSKQQSPVADYEKQESSSVETTLKETVSTTDNEEKSTPDGSTFDSEIADVKESFDETTSDTLSTTESTLDTTISGNSLPVDEEVSLAAKSVVSTEPLIKSNEEENLGKGENSVVEETKVDDNYSSLQMAHSSTESSQEVVTADTKSSYDASTASFSTLSHPSTVVNEQNTIQQGYHYTTGNTTYPMSEEDFYKLVVIVNAESNKTYEDALGVASVIANRCEDGGWGGDTPLEVATTQGQFVVWQNSSVRAAASKAASSHSFDNAEVVKAARDCFFGGIRNNDYVEFKSAGSSNYSSSGEKKYQLTSGGNKYHHLAEKLDRVHSYDIAQVTDINQIFDVYGETIEEESKHSLSA